MSTEHCFLEATSEVRSDTASQTCRIGPKKGRTKENHKLVASKAKKLGIYSSRGKH